MALQGSIQMVPLHGGIDTKTDPKFVQMPNMLVSENTRFTTIGQAAKRYGQTPLTNNIVGGGYISNGVNIGSFNDELLCFDGKAMYTYSASQNGWIQRAEMHEIDVAAAPVYAGNTSNVTSSRARNTELYVWTEAGALKWTTRDAASKISITPVQTLDTGDSATIIVYGDFFFVFYVNPGANTIYMRSLPIQNPTIGFNAAVAIAAFQPTGRYAVTLKENDPNSVWIAFYSPVAATFGISVLTFSLISQAVTDQTFINGAYALALTGDISAHCIFDVHTYTGPSGTIPQVWVRNYYYDTFGFSTQFFALVMNAGLGFQEVYLDANPAFMTDPNVSGQSTVSTSMSAVWDAVLSKYRYFVATTFYGNYTTGTGPVAFAVPMVYGGILTAASVSGLGTGARNLFLRSRIALRDGVAFCVAATAQYAFNAAFSTTLTGQSDYYVLVGDNTIPSLRFFGGEAESVISAFPPQLVQIDADTFQIGLTRVQELAASSTGPGVYGVASLTSTTLQFQSISQATVVPFQKTALISCGNTYSYDGANVVENGFWQFPKDIQIQSSTTPGDLEAGGTYTWQLCYEWTDIAGNLHISAPSYAITLTLNPGETSAAIYVPPLTTTLRTDVKIGVYRSAGGLTGSSYPLYREGEIANNPALALLTFQSTESDLVIQGRLPLYTNAGLGEVENEPAPAFKYIVATKNRVFGVPQDNPYQLWYSKKATNDSPAEFALPFYQQIETAGGDPTALGYIDAQAIVFKKERIYYLPGDGPDSTGQPVNGFAPLQLISTITGCSLPRTIIPTSEGLFFRSSTTMALLNRSLTLNQQIGWPVQGLNYLDLRGGAVVPEQNQLRWVSTDGTALVFDFSLQKWSTYTNYGGVGCLTTSTGQFYRLDNDGLVWKEDTSTYLDNGLPVVMKVATPWIKPGEQSQGFMAVWEAMLLGQYKTQHSLKVDIYYDYSETPLFTLTWNPQGVLNVSIYGNESPYGSTAYYGSTVQFAPAYQCRITPPRQMCQSIRFDIYDTGITGESCTLNEIELKLGNVGGLNRTLPKQTI